MDPAVQVLVFYGGLVAWTALLALGLRRRSWEAFLGFGIVLLLALNVRYFIEGATGGIAFFIAIYDVLDNLGINANDPPAALAACPDNACTVWGDRYTQHPSWGVAFHERFVTASTWRSGLLYTHIGFNSIAFVLMHIQMLRPGTGSNRGLHRMLGRISFGAVTLGTLAAILLASEHSPVSEYGGVGSMLGFYSMSLFVYGCAVMMVRAIRGGDVEAHRKWTMRFAGSMWGAFWLFRVMLFVLHPILRNYESVALLICIWGSAPLGILIAEAIRRRSASSEAGAGGAITDLREVAGLRDLRSSLSNQ